jgi:mono/diheme cytochrome c family protein
VKRSEAARWSGAALCAAALLMVTRGAGAFPWSIDMFRGESVQALARAPRVMPPGTLPVNGVPPMSREVASLSLRNPVKPTPEALAHGKLLFDTDCAVCHDSNGRGDGPVRFLLRIPPADLTHGVSTQRSDGYIYATIRNGSIVMPAYGDAMSADEIWDVVLYVRSLQRPQVGAK